MKKQRISASKQRKGRIVVKASKNLDDMLNAFEARLEDLGVESSTDINASDDVEISKEDHYDRYQDVGGGFGGSGDDIISLADAKEYWNQNKDSDPSLSYYTSFGEWWRDTRDNFLVEAGTCTGDEDDIE